LQGAEVVDAALDLGELRSDQFLEPGTQVLAAPGVRVGGDLPDAGQWEPDPLGAADKLKALEVLR
jgi:hypothetical protein